MKIFSKNLILLFLILTALSLAACKPGTTGLFESIAGEATSGTNPSRGFKQASVGSVVRLGDTFYASMGKLWQRPVEGVRWVPATNLPTGFEYAESLVVADGKMYAILRDADGDNPTIRSFDGTDWAIATLSLPEDHSLRGLFAANDSVFAWSENYDSKTTPPSSTFSVYVLDGSVFAGVAGLSIVSGVPNSLLWDGSTYWLGTNKTLYSGTATAMTEQSLTAGGATLDDSFGGIAFLNGTYILTTTSGKVYRSANGTVWELPADGNLPQNSAKLSYRFNPPTVLAHAAKNWILAPSLSLVTSGSTANARGYVLYELKTEAMTRIVNFNPFSDYINNDTSIGVSSVRFFAVFEDSPEAGKTTVFAGTQENGLWSNTFNGIVWTKWLRESDR